MQEQVDAALGAEEMVENLTTKCLDLEDKLAALLEEKADLEALHDINEEMQVSTLLDKMRKRCLSCNHYFSDSMKYIHGKS